LIFDADERVPLNGKRVKVKALARLRRLKPDLPRVLSSGYNDAECLRPLADRRISGFPHEPYTAGTLGAAVKAALPYALRPDEAPPAVLPPEPRKTL
jgi:hypothetical protein